MDRTISSTSTSSSASGSDLLGYQKQLLERKSSLSRSNSRTAGVLAGAAPHSSSGAATHKWQPGHRSAQSVDAVRNKWEEMVARESSPERAQSNQSQPTKRPTPIVPVAPPVGSLTSSGSSATFRYATEAHDSDVRARKKTEDESLFGRQKALPLTPVINFSNIGTSISTSPIKRLDSLRSTWEKPLSDLDTPSSSPAQPFGFDLRSHTPISPENTGSTNLTRSDSVSSTSSIQRLNSIRSKWELRERELKATERSIGEGTPTSHQLPVASTVIPKPVTVTPQWSSPTRTRKSNSLSTEETPFKTPTKSSNLDEIRRKYGLQSKESSPERKQSTFTPTALKRHTLPASMTASTSGSPVKENLSGPFGQPPPISGQAFATPSPTRIYLSSSTDLQSSSLSAVKHLGSAALPSPERTPKAEFKPWRNGHLDDQYKPPPLSPSASSAMFPSTYRPSEKSTKKSYGESLTDGRRLGRHLPRIASGEVPPEDNETPLSRRGAYRRRTAKEASTELVIPGITGASDVTGIPGRLRLSRASKENAPAPLPSSRLSTGLWADVQRHLLQAYEYLCHVGEAQQWIEGCIGAELGFGVVEMEEGLRNGVVLAKLVRVFEGDKAVKRIFEAPKLDYRHTDNIVHFLQFVRRVGLPESFIFETLDLYEKKNFPKVVYSVHALSHLLARRGMAERIGNLLGQLKFSDDQLRQTQKGLEHSGLPLPNFGSVGKELAKEINEEPEVEPETDDERRDRLLLENEGSIIKLQSLARASLVRRDQSNQRARLQLADNLIIITQARSRGVLARHRVNLLRERRSDCSPWATKLQASARALLVRRSWRQRKALLTSRLKFIVKLQAQSRGALQRRRFARLKAALQSCKFTVTKLQMLSRAKLVKRSHKELKKTLEARPVLRGITSLQGAARGVLVRRMEAARRTRLLHIQPSIVGLQAQARGVLVRRRMRKQLARLVDISDVVIQIQAAARAYLAGKKLLNLIRGLRRAGSATVGLQARARATIARRKHRDMSKALAEVKVIKSVGGLQSFARAALARNHHREQAKRLEFCAPDVVGLQATCRGFLVRYRYNSWRDHLHNNIPTVIHLQCLFRGLAQKRKYLSKMQYYRANLDKVVKIQSLMRAKDTREQYRRLTLGQNVNVSTIKNFVHLLDDSETDFKQEIEVEKLRERLVRNIRETQALETDVSELDVKIALVVQNVKSFEELVRARRRHGADSAAAHAARATVLAVHGDPFAGPNTLDHATKRKLELYQQLFYMLQTRSEYLARLLFTLSRSELPDKTKRLCERIVLTLFGYGQNRREDFLLLKVFQHSIHEEIRSAKSIADVAKSYPLYMNVAVNYVRPKQVVYVREAFQALIREIIDQEDLNLETDPSALHRNHVNVEEMKTGKLSSIPKDVSFHDAIDNYYPETRGEYIRNLQRLQALTKSFVQAIMSSTKKLPYGIRYIARETLAGLRTKFPQESPEFSAACVGRLIYYRFINAAIVTPETFDLVPNTISPIQRKNLAAISKVLTQIASGTTFDNDSIALVPLNDYVSQAGRQVAKWFMDIADVPEPEIQLDAYEFLDVAVQPKPIFISPNEVYSMHRLLIQQSQIVTPRRDDPLRIILNELDGVPNLGSEDLNEARDRAITLELTNRFAEVEDPHAAEKALWVQAKRSVLAILRVQPAKDLIDSLMRPVDDEHEFIWEEIIERDLMAEQMRHHERRMPSTGGDAAYRLEDIQSLSFRDVKAHAISCLLKLEKQNKVTRTNGYQGILDAIAGDVRSKHKKRIERQKEIESMQEALKHLGERKRSYLEQIESYNNYVEAAMQTMQRGKGKKRFVMPFTKQYFHLRDLQRTGLTPQFGSFKYSALDLYDKGILLSIDQYSPRQFDRIDVVLSSNKVGVFAMEIHHTTLGAPNSIASTDIRLDDLLQSQFENRVSLALFNGMAKFNVNLLLYQLNKKFYV